jgi:hypothetical protein
MIFSISCLERRCGIIRINKYQNKQLKAMQLKHRVIPRHIPANHRSSAKSFSTTNSTKVYWRHYIYNLIPLFISLSLSLLIMPFTVNFRFSGFRTLVVILLRQSPPPRGWFGRNVMKAHGRPVGFLHPPIIAPMSLSSVTLCQSADLPSRRRWFHPRLIHVGYVMKEVALR